MNSYFSKISKGTTVPEESSNSISQIKAYLSTPEKPVSTQEAMEFWKSLSDDDKEYYKKVELT
jgi:hypothetical protein